MKFEETHNIELKSVLNDGNIIGIKSDKLDEIMKKISDIITDKILPNPQEFVTSSAIMVDGKWIIKIEVLKKGMRYIILKNMEEVHQVVI